MSYYSGTQADVTLMMRTVGVGTGREDLLDPDDLEGYQKRADTIINSRLSGSYHTPLREVTVDSITKYPDPIPYLAQIFVTLIIYRSVFTEIEPNMSQAVDALQAEVDAQIAGLIDGAAIGSNILRGQRLTARNHFQNPRVAPRENPAGGGTVV